MDLHKGIHIYSNYNEKSSSVSLRCRRRRIKFLQSELDLCAYAAPETGLGDGGVVVVFLVEEIRGVKIYRPAGGIPRETGIGDGIGWIITTYAVLPSP